MHKEKITIDLSLPDDSELAAVDDGALAAAMDAEINQFQEWFQKSGNDPLIGIERSILKTYFAWKLRYADVVMDSEV